MSGTPPPLVRSSPDSSLFYSICISLLANKRHVVDRFLQKLYICTLVRSDRLYASQISTTCPFRIPCSTFDHELPFWVESLCQHSGVWIEHNISVDQRSCLLYGLGAPLHVFWLAVYLFTKMVLFVISSVIAINALDVRSLESIHGPLIKTAYA